MKNEGGTILLEFTLQQGMLLLWNHFLKEMQIKHRLEKALRKQINFIINRSKGDCPDQLLLEDDKRIGYNKNDKIRR